MARIVFFCHDSREHIDAFEYYRQDIDALRDLGHDVVVCNRYRDIPRRFDAMFVWWWTFALWPALRARVTGRPCLITGVYNFRHPPSYQGNDYFRRPLWQRALIRSAMQLASLNLFIDERECREAAAHFGIRTARHYPCILPDDYVRGPGSERELALFNVAWSGRGNLIRKGIPELLQAVRILKDWGEPARLYLAGLPGDAADHLEQRIDALGIRDRVVSLGKLERNAKIERLRTYEVYVQPSHFEGFGLATAEAMGCGACVITCDVGAVRSVVGDAGLYVTPGVPEELAHAIRRVLADEPLRRSLQQTAHARARTMFRAPDKRARIAHYLNELGLAARART